MYKNEGLRNNVNITFYGYLYRDTHINYKTTLLGVNDSIKGIYVISRNISLTLYLPIHSKFTC